MSYVADPNLSTAPLTQADLDTIVASKGKGLVKSARNFQHFLDRVVVTVKAYRTQVQQLSRQIQQMQIEGETGGAATTLHPLDSFRYLSDDEKKRVMDASLAAKYDQLTSELAAVKASRAEADRVVGMAKYQLVAIDEDPSVPQRVKDRLKAIIDGHPAGDAVAALDEHGHPAGEPADAPAKPQRPPQAGGDLSELFG